MSCLSTTRDSKKLHRVDESTQSHSEKRTPGPPRAPPPPAPPRRRPPVGRRCQRSGGAQPPNVGGPARRDALRKSHPRRRRLPTAIPQRRCRRCRCHCRCLRVAHQPRVPRQAPCQRCWRRRLGKHRRSAAGQAGRRASPTLRSLTPPYCLRFRPQRLSPAALDRLCLTLPLTAQCTAQMLAEAPPAAAPIGGARPPASCCASRRLPPAWKHVGVSTPLQLLLLLLPHGPKPEAFAN